MSRYRLCSVRELSREPDRQLNRLVRTEGTINGLIVIPGNPRASDPQESARFDGLLFENDCYIAFQGDDYQNRLYRSVRLLAAQQRGEAVALQGRFVQLNGVYQLRVTGLQYKGEKSGF